MILETTFGINHEVLDPKNLKLSLNVGHADDFLYVLNQIWELGLPEEISDKIQTAFEKKEKNTSPQGEIYTEGIPREPLELNLSDFEAVVQFLKEKNVDDSLQFLTSIMYVCEVQLRSNAIPDNYKSVIEITLSHPNPGPMAKEVVSDLVPRAGAFTDQLRALCHLATTMQPSTFPDLPVNTKRLTAGVLTGYDNNSNEITYNNAFGNFIQALTENLQSWHSYISWLEIQPGDKEIINIRELKACLFQFAVETISTIETLDKTPEVTNLIALIESIRASGTARKVTYSSPPKRELSVRHVLGKPSIERAVRKSFVGID